MAEPGDGLGSVGDLDLLLGFDGLVHPLTPIAIGHGAPRELIDDHNLSVINDMLLAQLIEFARNGSEFVTSNSEFNTLQDGGGRNAQPHYQDPAYQIPDRIAGKDQSASKKAKWARPLTPLRANKPPVGMIDIRCVTILFCSSNPVLEREIIANRDCGRLMNCAGENGDRISNGMICSGAIVTLVKIAMMGRFTGASGSCVIMITVLICTWKTANFSAARILSCTAAPTFRSAVAVCLMPRALLGGRISVSVVGRKFNVGEKDVHAFVS
jgi:hypothetical protein